MTRTRRWVRRTALAGAAASAGMLVAATVAAPASADAPSQVGWWSDHPDPSTPAGGIHVEVVPQHLAAYGAVLFMMPTTATATLTLKLAGTGGSGSLQACPTKDSSWKAGDAQSMSDAPGFDCTVHALQGMASSDGKSLTFLVDGSIESTPGSLSLAIVPVQTTAAPAVGTDTGTDTTAPFYADIDKPDASSFTITSGGSSTSGAMPPPPPPPAATGVGSTGSAPAAGSSSVPASGPISMPGGATTASVPTSTDTGAAPVVAGQNGASSTLTPVAAKSGTTNNRAHDAAFALLVLLAVAVLSGGGTGQRMPRRLGGGGAHRAAPAPAAAGAATAAAAMPMMPGFASRGLGRFAKPRTTAPRPLT